MTRLSNALCIALLALLTCSALRAWADAPRATGPDADVEAKAAEFGGQWQSSFGVLTLKQTGDKVEGEYDTPPGKVTGTVSGRKLTFTYQEASVAGEGWFELEAGGKAFTGKWRPGGAPGWAEWVGKRIAAEAPAGFTGLWQTTYGRMRLREGSDGNVRGCYSFGGRSDVTGSVKDGVLAFTYEQPDGEKGKGTFKLSDDGKSFAGDWTGGANGGPAGGGKWSGKRVEPQKGKVWLVVLEAPWEHDLAENEYSYGLMLRTFFARVPHVQVRHRSIQSEGDLRRWVAETTYLAEPVVLYFSSHGTHAGLSVGGKTVGPDVLADALRDHADLQLLHFGSCLVAGGDFTTKFRASLTKSGGDASFPISGFKHTADWGGSAVIDFIYLDLIFSHRLPPAQAAEQTRRMLSFAGEETKQGDAIPAAGLVEFEPAGEN